MDSADNPGAPARHPIWGHRALSGLLVIAIILLLKETAALLVPIAAALVLTFVFAPVVRWLRRHGVRETIGAGVVVVLLLGVTGLFASTLARPAAEWWDRAPTTVAQVMARLERLRIAFPVSTPVPPASAAPRAAKGRPTTADLEELRPDPIKEHLATEGFALTRAVLVRLVGFCVSAAATVILLYFLLASEHWVISRSVEAIPRRRARALLLAGLRSVQREISHFLGALAVVNLGVGIAMSVAAWWLELPNPVLWGTLCGLLNFIPYLGPMIGATMLLMAGLLTFDSLPQIVAPAAALLAIHATESNFISPFYVGKQLSLSPVSMCLSVMFWGWLWGLAGAVMAVPLLVAVRALCKRQRRLRLFNAYLEGTRKPVTSLRSLIGRNRRGAVADAAKPRSPRTQRGR
ncbi:AI-2E family transporter [Ideonella sp. YS5]|uniref:AI-2E family transporter n=1 Tax=Ideonella sp. YS5 TaxID=3453714 RepID=UPI003EEE9F58